MSLQLENAETADIPSFMKSLSVATGLEVLVGPDSAGFFLKTDTQLVNVIKDGDFFSLLIYSLENDWTLEGLAMADASNLEAVLKDVLM